MSTSKHLLSGADAWLKISRRPRFFFGLCHEIRHLLDQDLIGRQTARSMEARVGKLLTDGRSYIWAPGTERNKRRKLAALLAKGKYAEARKFVKEAK